MTDPAAEQSHSAAHTPLPHHVSDVIFDLVYLIQQYSPRINGRDEKKELTL